MKPNLRELLNVSNEYHTFNREERYYAALLYHMLLKPSELKKFLNKYFKDFIGEDYNESEVRIFYEYAHIRDLWYAAKEEKNKLYNKDLRSVNKDLRSVIIELLDSPKMESYLMGLSDPGFNDFFGAKSEKHIQMPGRWSKGEFSTWIDKGGHDFAIKACKLIWAFNAKADLVIHIGNNKAICIEAKVASNESSYRASAGKSHSEVDFIMKQTQIQEFILNDLLGYETTFTYLSKKETKAPNYLNWNDVFKLMDKSNEFDFVKESILNHIIS